MRGDRRHGGERLAALGIRVGRDDAQHPKGKLASAAESHAPRVPLRSRARRGHDKHEADTPRSSGAGA